MPFFLSDFLKAHPGVELVLDVDATHVPLHGQQERAHFNAHYDVVPVGIDPEGLMKMMGSMPIGRVAM